MYFTVVIDHLKVAEMVFISFFVTKEEKEICGNLLSAVLKIFMFQSCEKLKRRGKKKRERKLE